MFVDNKNLSCCSSALKKSDYTKFESILDILTVKSVCIQKWWLSMASIDWFLKAKINAVISLLKVFTTELLHRYLSSKMDFESLENMDKSEFLPLGTVKQEVLDPANGIDNVEAAENTAINSATTNNTLEPVEINNPVCDSAEKQVKCRTIRPIV